MGKSPLCLLCLVVSQIPLQQLVATNKSATRRQLPHLWSYGETCLMDFGHYTATAELIVSNLLRYKSTTSVYWPSLLAGRSTGPTCHRCTPQQPGRQYQTRRPCLILVYNLEPASRRTRTRWRHDPSCIVGLRTVRSPHQRMSVDRPRGRGGRSLEAAAFSRCSRRRSRAWTRVRARRGEVWPNVDSLMASIWPQYGPVPCWLRRRPQDDGQLSSQMSAVLIHNECAYKTKTTDFKNQN